MPKIAGNQQDQERPGADSLSWLERVLPHGRSGFSLRAGAGSPSRPLGGTNLPHLDFGPVISDFRLWPLEL